MDKLRIFREAPNIKRIITNCQTKALNPGKAKTILNKTAQRSIQYLLLYLFNNFPVNGIVNIKPIGNANKTAPNCASVKCNCAFILGIRDAQDEYPNPETKKNTVFANLNPLGECCSFLK
jgi:hypothetical protein